MEKERQKGRPAGWLMSVQKRIKTAKFVAEIHEREK